MFIHIVLFISYFNVGIKKKSELFLKKCLIRVCKGLNEVYNKGIETNNKERKNMREYIQHKLAQYQRLNPAKRTLEELREEVLPLIPQWAAEMRQAERS